MDRRLAPLFRGRAHRVGSGFWVSVSEPIALAWLLDEALGDDERKELEGTFGDWPRTAEEVIEGSDARRESVLTARTGATSSASRAG